MKNMKEKLKAFTNNPSFTEKSMKVGLSFLLVFCVGILFYGMFHDGQDVDVEAAEKVEVNKETLIEAANIETAIYNDHLFEDTGKVYKRVLAWKVPGSAKRLKIEYECEVRAVYNLELMNVLSSDDNSYYITLVEPDLDVDVTMVQALIEYEGLFNELTSKEYIQLEQSAFKDAKDFAIQFGVLEMAKENVEKELTSLVRKFTQTNTPVYFNYR